MIEKGASGIMSLSLLVRDFSSNPDSNSGWHNFDSDTWNPTVVAESYISIDTILNILHNFKLAPSELFFQVVVRMTL